MDAWYEKEQVSACVHVCVWYKTKQCMYVNASERESDSLCICICVKRNQALYIGMCVGTGVRKRRLVCERLVWERTSNCECVWVWENAKHCLYVVRLCQLICGYACYIESEAVCVCVWERERERERESERDMCGDLYACMWYENEWVIVHMCIREKVKHCLCLRKRERERERNRFTVCVHAWEKVRYYVHECVCEREKESEKERERERESGELYACIWYENEGVILCMCSRKRERESERERKKKRDIHCMRTCVRESAILCSWVRVCVCVWEREREREREMHVLNIFHIAGFWFPWTRKSQRTIK